EKVKLAGALIKQAEQARSELMLEIELLEVDKNRALDLGIVPPTMVRAIPLSGSDVKSLLQATDLANLLTLVQQVFAAHGISPVPPVIPVPAQDFNNDSQKDLAVVNQQDNSVSILLNQGNGNFSQPNPAIVLGTNETGPAAIASSVFRLIDTTTNLAQPADLVIANST